MLLRLVVSAAVAFTLLAALVVLGTRVLQSGPRTDAVPGEPAPTGFPLRRSDSEEPRFTQRDVDALRAFLSVSPADRLEEALARSDVRFLGVNGFTLHVPSVDDPLRAIREGRVLPIPGTTEATISSEHARLVERADRYAGAYNALLLRHVVD